jgi:hypothetical protein
MTTWHVNTVRYETRGKKASKGLNAIYFHEDDNYNRYGIATCLNGKKTREGRFEIRGGKEERGTFCNPAPKLGNLFYQKLTIIHSF